jgi:hypothetical protein
MSNPLRDLTPQQLRRAATLKEKIASLQIELDQLLSGVAGPALSPKPGRKISEAGRARIVEAQKRRWAKKKKAVRK